MHCNSYFVFICCFCILPCVCFVSGLNAFMSSVKHASSFIQKKLYILFDTCVCVCSCGSLQGLSTRMQTQKSSASQWRTAVWLTWSGWMKPFRTTDASLKSEPSAAWTAVGQGHRAVCTGCRLKALDGRVQKQRLNKFILFCCSDLFTVNSLMYCGCLIPVL